MRNKHGRVVPGEAPRRGDVWEVTNNNGIIMRIVLSVACGVVSYTCNGFFRRCSIKAFKDWNRSASLTSADDWTNRRSS